ncbi:hypothetical protein [Acinetobacter guillouiae]|uniref:hypothetical protein n=1 Tax=Acinetobacter guillouiae TaxID=106649 RepID=UPI001AE19C45|nr:hypothetical protein [Acinetobacter guillouiae]MBP2546710.1 hypothetical protein [Acinetobacter guillouiae]
MKCLQTLIKGCLFALPFFSSYSAFAQADAAVEVDPEYEVLGRAGKLKIQKESCTPHGSSCDYVLYDAKGKKQVLIEKWSKTANVYQFNPNLMGFLLGLTGSEYNLTVINDKNQQKDYSSFLAMNGQQSCFVTFESNLKNMPNSLVFYSIPDFRVRLVLNNKVPQFKKLNYPATANFEDNGDFSFNYNIKIGNEMGVQDVIIQNPCQSDYRVIMS